MKNIAKHKKLLSIHVFCIVYFIMFVRNYFTITLKNGCLFCQPWKQVIISIWAMPRENLFMLHVYANNKGADQPVHPHSLISAFVVRCLRSIIEPCHEIMVLFLLCKLILQTCMHSHPMRLGVTFLVYFHTSCVRTSKAQARLCECAGSPEPSLVAYVISTIIS